MKTIKQITLIALMAVLGVTMTSCGGYSNSKAKEMIIKSEDDKLKKEDYADMIEWYEACNSKYLDKWEKILADKDSYLEYQLSMIEFNADFTSDYPFMNDVEHILKSAVEEEMVKANLNKFEKLEEKFEKRADKYGEKASKMRDKYLEKKSKKLNSDFE